MTSGPAPDVTVVGAGLVGALTALRLAERGLSVCLVERDFPGAGSTGAAMGHLVTMDDSAAQLALCTLSQRLWRDLIPTLPADAEHDGCGTLWLAADHAEMEHASRRAEGYRAHGVQADLVDAAELRRLEPHVRHGLAGALRVPGDGVCYPPAIARRLSERAVAAGARMVRASVTGVEPGAVVLADGTRLPTGAVVIAAGAHSPALVEGLPVVPRKGHLVITHRAPGLVHHQLVELGYMHSAHSMGGASVAFNVQPRLNGQLLVGSSRELVGFDARINRPLVHAMLERATAMIPALAGTRAWRTWTGFRPATVDSLPLIGGWPRVPGTWIATGHEGLGITLAPGTAALITAAIAGDPAPIDPAPFDPSRSMPALGAAA